MEFIQEKTFEAARKKIRASKEKVIFYSNDDELNRKILEKENIAVLLISQKNRIDFQKQRNSGFNQVLAKLAKKKGVIIGIDLDEIIDSRLVERSQVIARIRQNIKLCNKDKLNMTFISQKYKRNSYDLLALGLVLGMPTWMFKEIN
jgi:RNase P/RNase MRP subunit p30